MERERGGTEDMTMEDEQGRGAMDGRVLIINQLTRNVTAEHLKEIAGVFGRVVNVELARDKEANNMHMVRDLRLSDDNVLLISRSMSSCNTENETNMHSICQMKNSAS